MMLIISTAVRTSNLQVHKIILDSIQTGKYSWVINTGALTQLIIYFRKVNTSLLRYKITIFNCSEKIEHI